MTTTRPMTVASLMHPERNKARLKEPRPGTKVRTIYDALLDGKEVFGWEYGVDDGYITVMMYRTFPDMYGLEPYRTLSGGWKL